MLEQALRGARLLYAYTMFIEAPIDEVFRFTGDPDYWARDYDGDPQPTVGLQWEARAYKPGSTMVLSPRRKDGTFTTVGAIKMELLHYQEDREISFRYLSGNHLIYRFVYEEAGPNRTEFTVNALIDAQSPPLNTIRQRLYAKSRRRNAIKDHLRVKGEIEARTRRKSKGR